jgi:glycopeptide antibiotics resistance protein
MAGYFVIFNNILLTIPLGFGLNFLCRLRMKDILCISAVGLGIELLQLALTLLLRYPYRVVDINDVWLNAMGVLIGYGLFQAFAWSYRQISQRLSIKPGRLSAYLSAVADRSSGGSIH